MSTMSRSQQPCSVPADACLWLLLWSQYLLYLVFLSSCCLLFFPKFSAFPKNPTFSCYAPSRSTSVLSFLPSAMFCIISGFIFLKDHLFIFLVVPSICIAPLQHLISNESIVLLSTYFTVQLSHPYLVIRNTRV